MCDYFGQNFLTIWPKLRRLDLCRGSLVDQSFDMQIRSLHKVNYWAQIHPHLGWAMDEISYFLYFYQVPSEISRFFFHFRVPKMGSDGSIRKVHKFQMSAKLGHLQHFPKNPIFHLHQKIRNLKSLRKLRKSFYIDSQTPVKNTGTEMPERIRKLRKQKIPIWVLYLLPYLSLPSATLHHTQPLQ